MIWFTLALFVVSFLIVALLTPKPNIENARADTLDSVDFPRATEDAPIPLVLGKVRMKAPNTIWYGDFEAVPIKEKVKTGLFSSKRITIGYTYYLGLDLALAMGPGTVLTEIYIDDKSAWTGSAGPGASAVNGIYLNLGGYKKGGSFKSDAIYYSGELDVVNQPINSYLEGQIGAGDVPAYLGTAHIVFPKAELGESAQLRKMAFILENYTNDLGLPNNGKVGDNMNPAEAIYQIMTNTWRGMGVNPAVIDTTSLSAIGTTLFNEGNGVSIVVTAESTGSSLVQEILRQIDGVAYQDPDTGRIIFKLIRDDYDVELLPSYDENDVIKIQNFSRTSWDEVVAQVKISYAARDSDSSRVAISQDMATANMIGRLRSTTLSMPFCYDSVLANKIASRERAQLSIPLFRITVEFNRNANTLRPGDVFKLNWSEYGLTNLVLRVQEFDFGELAKGRIVAKCLQDSFALDNVVFADPPPSSWVAPVVQPQDISAAVIVEMPRFFMNKLEFPIPDGNAGVIPLPVSPGGSSSGFDMVAGTVSGSLEVREPAEVSYPASGTLTAIYDRLAGFTSGRDVTGFTVTNIVGTFEPAPNATAARSGESGLLYVDGEWMTFETAVNNGNGTWTLSNIERGLLGSMPKTHAIGTRVFQVSVELLGEGTLDDLLETDVLYYKLLDRVGATVRDEDQVGQSTFNTNALADRPVRPRLVKLDGSRATNIVIADQINRPLTWVNSNREAATIARESDPSETPDQAETYDVQVFVDGVLNAVLSSTGETSPYTLPTSLTSITSANCEVRVTSRRTVGNLRSSVAYAWLPFELAQDLIKDAFWSYVSFVSGFEGSEGGTVVYNEKAPSAALTIGGTPTTVVAAAFGGTRGLAINETGGSGDYVDLGTPAASGCDFGTGDFTIEGYAQSKYNHSIWYHSVLGNFNGSDTGSWSIFLKNSGGVLQFNLNGYTNVDGTTALGTSSFHFAVSRTGDTIRLFINGILEGKVTGYAAVNIGGTGNVRVGGNQAGTNDQWRGYIDELRITKGYSRYSSDSSFTPTAPVRQYDLPLINADAETGDLTGWTNSGVGVRSASPAPHAGSYYFYGGTIADSNAYQDIAVPVGIQPTIDLGNTKIQVDWWQTSFADSNQANIKLEFFDGSMLSLGTDPGPGLIAASSAAWTARSIDQVSVPSGTRTIRVTMEYHRTAGTNNDGYIDDISSYLIW